MILLYNSYLAVPCGITGWCSCYKCCDTILILRSDPLSLMTLQSVMLIPTLINIH